MKNNPFTRAYAAQRFFTWRRQTFWRRVADLASLITWAVLYFVVLAALVISHLVG